MRNDIIQDSDHVSRYCKPRSLSPSTGLPTGASFMLRDDETYLSVNWLEYLKKTSRVQEIEEVRRIFAKKFNVASTGMFAVVNVGNTRNFVKNESNDSRQLQFIHEPEDNDPSHSGIHGISHQDNLTIAQLIADTVMECHYAK